MKVLWYSLSPCGSMRRDRVNRYIQGWMISLEDEIKKNKEIELSVAFFSNRKEEPFKFEGVHYYPIFMPISKNKIGRIVGRYKSYKKVDLQFLPEMLKIVDMVKPDLIHIHGTEERFGLIQDFVNIPVVFSIQGLLAPYTEKFYSGLPAHFVEKNEGVLLKLKGVSSRRNFTDYSYRAKRELSYLQKAKFVIGRTCFDHVIPLLCNPTVRLFQGEEILRADFYNKSWSKTSFAKRIKLVTTISPGIYKGFETLLHAASLLSQYAEFEFEWSIIGYTSEEGWIKIAERYKKMSSKKCSIKFLGRKNAAEMVDVMLNSDIYIQVSHIENSPNSVCEAMLLGMPIIASFAGGTSSILSDGKEGILVQDGDPYTLAGMIVWLSQNFDSGKKMGINAKMRALKRHDRQRISEHLFATYKEILSLYNNA